MSARLSAESGDWLATWSRYWSNRLHRGNTSATPAPMPVGADKRVALVSHLGTSERKQNEDRNERGGHDDEERQRHFLCVLLFG